MTNTTPFTFEQLQEALDYAGLYDFDISPAYSGRGMYGKTCFGITHDGTDVKVTLAIVWACRDAYAKQNGGDEDFDEIMELASDIAQRACGDSMGRQAITYFPGWELPGDCELEDDRELATTLEDALDEFGRLV